MVVANKKEVKLIGIELENFKRLNVKEEFDEDARSVTVSGPNGIGKSTFIDAMFICLTGEEIPEEPIQTGKTKASIKCTLKREEAIYIATLEFKKDSAGKIKRTFTLKIDEILHDKTKDARKLLEDLIGSIYVDIFDLIQLQPRDLKDKLQEMLKLNFDDLDGKKKALLADKLTLENKRDSFEDQLNTLDFADDGKIYEKKDASDLLAKINEARDIEAAKTKASNELSNITDNIAVKEDQMQKFKAAMIQLKIEIDELITKQATVKSNYDLIEVPDVSKIQEEAKSVDENNKKADSQSRFKELVGLKTKTDDAIAIILGQIKKIEQERIDRIANVKLPVEGLGFDADGLTYKGLPLNESQVSSGELIELGAAIAVGLNPKLRIIRVKDASLLDSKHKAAIQKVADQYNFMVFYEVVADTDKLGIEYNEV